MRYCSCGHDIGWHDNDMLCTNINIDIATGEPCPCTGFVEVTES